MLKKILCFLLCVCFTQVSLAQEIIKPLEKAIETSEKKDLTSFDYPIFDDNLLLNGYSKKYENIPKGILLEMIRDETLTSFKTAAAVRVFRQKYISEVVSKEKKYVKKTLIQRLKKTESPFVQVEIMITLCHLDRYDYFKETVPELIKKLNHYNDAVNNIAFEGLESIIDQGNNRAREARIVFNTLRKVLFLSRKRLANIDEPSSRLAQKLKLLRWSIKILGTQELKKLSKEVLNLL
jgi:hypothetical protein